MRLQVGCILQGIQQIVILRQAVALSICRLAKSEWALRIGDVPRCGGGMAFFLGNAEGYLNHVALTPKQWVLFPYPFSLLQPGIPSPRTFPPMPPSSLDSR